MIQIYQIDIIDVPDKPIFQIVVFSHIWTDFVMKNTATEISNLFYIPFKFILSLFIEFILILTLKKLQKLFHFLGCLTSLIAV